MRISDWSSDVCSSDLGWSQEKFAFEADIHRTYISDLERGARNPTITVVEKLALRASDSTSTSLPVSISPQVEALTKSLSEWPRWLAQSADPIFSAMSRSRVSSSGIRSRSEEHTSELQSLMRHSYAVFCLKK